MPKKWILHVDMDAFFASIEQLDNPQLRGKPLIVGGEHRGVVSTCSYEARKFGVHSAMPIHEAKRLCPHAFFIKPRMTRYLEVSAAIHKLFDKFSPLVEMASVDEAYLDISGMSSLYASPINLGMDLKNSIREITNGLTCSVGIAPVKFLAKISSEINKPDGFFILPHENVSDFLSTLPVGKIPGIGGHLVKKLSDLGIVTCLDVFKYSREFLEEHFGKVGELLWNRSHGIDEREVMPFREPKSEGAEVTLDEDTLDLRILQRWLLRHSERIGRRLRANGYAGRVITVKIKYTDFKVITKQVTLPMRVNDTAYIYNTACDILRQIPLKSKVRLIGVSVSGFEQEKALQLSLFSQDEEKTARQNIKLDCVLDSLREKYGKDSIVRGLVFSKNNE